MADKSPAFQFYPKDFLSDEKQHVMSLAECGAYTRLLCQCWLEGSLPQDLGKLARLCGATAVQMNKLWPAIRPCFREAEAGRLIHPRLERERGKQADFRRRQSDNGRMGGRPRNPEEPKPNPSLSSGLTQTKAKKSSPSPISDLRSPKSNTAEPKHAPPVIEFLTWFPTEYQARREGAVYCVVWAKHGAIVKRLLATYPLERLKDLTIVLLTATVDEWITGTDRGIEILAAKINWLEETLCAWEAKHGKRASGG